MNSRWKDKIVGAIAFLLMLTGVFHCSVSFAATTIQSGNKAVDAFVNYALQMTGKTYSELGLSGQWCGRFVGYCGTNSGLAAFIPTISELSGADGAVKYGYKYGAKNYYFFDDMDMPAGSVSVRSDLATFEPQPGDIVTFRRLSSNSMSASPLYRYSHLAIVWKVDSEYIYVVHGNWGSDGTVKSNTRFKRNGVSSWYSDAGADGKVYYCVGAYTRPAFSDAEDHYSYDPVKDPATGHEYLLVPGQMSWTAAQSYARSLGEGYDLATMDGSSANEQGIIENLVQSYGYACWLGGSRVDGSWQWVNGISISTSDSRWDDGEPSGETSSGSAEYYLGIYANSTQTSYATTNKWNDFSLSSGTIKGFVVEYTPAHDTSWTPMYYQRAVYALLPDQGYLKAEPYAEADNLFKFEDGNRIVEISGAYVNKYGNVWLKVERIWLNHSSNDAIDVEGYVYAEHAVYANEMASASCTGSVLPSNVIRQGDKVDIKGSITSTDSITSVSVFLYQLPEYSMLQKWTFTNSDVLGHLTTTVDLEDLRIGETLDLGSLDEGEYYLYIMVPVKRPDNYAETGTQAYEVTFEVKAEGIQQITFARPTGSYADRLAVLKGTFPEGWYWNQWSESELGTGVQYNITIGSQSTSVSTVPCSSTHSDNTYWGAWHGTKGCGFARMLFDLTWNMDTEADCYCYKYSMSSDEDGYFLDYLAPGDMVYTGGNGVNRYYYITGVDGDVVTYAACNADGTCEITWNNQTSKQLLLAEMEAGAEASPKVSGYICSPVPIAFGASEFTWEPYAVTVSSATFKRTASASSLITDSFVLSEGDVFYVGTNHLCEDKNGAVWGYCRTNDNQYGWLRIDNGSCEPTEVTSPSISMLSWEEGTSIAFIEQDDEVFHVGSTAVITLLDTSVSGFTWSTMGESIFLLEPYPDDEYRCLVTALQPGTTQIVVAGIISPEFTVPLCYTVEHEGAVFTFEAEQETDENTMLTLERIEEPAGKTQIPATVNGYPVTSISHGTQEEDNTIRELKIANGIEAIHDDAFSYTLHAIETVSVPSSMLTIGSGAFAFDYPVFVDFYFDALYTVFEPEAILMDTGKLGDAPVYGEDYRITFHCRVGSSAESYALGHGWDVVYTDEVQLEFAQTEVDIFCDEPFSMSVLVPVNVIPSALQDKITLVYSVSNACVEIDDFGGLTPVKPGTATVTVSWGDVSTEMTVRVIGKTEYADIPAGVKIIESDAFLGNRSLRAVILPEGIERIESRAFAGCSGIKAVWLPDSLTYIAPDAFEGCSEMILYLPMDGAEIALNFAQYYEYPYVRIP